MQITHLVRDSPLRDLGVVLSRCAHVVVLDDEDSFESDPEEELDIADDDNGDSDEIDDDYVPEGGSGGSGELDGEGVKYRKRGWVLFRGGVGKIQKEGVGARQQEGVGKIHKKGVGKIQKEGVGEIQKEGVGKVHKKGVGKIQREGAGAIQKEGVGEIPKEGEGSGMGKGMWGSKRKHSATPPPTPSKKVVPRLPGVHIKAKMPVQTTHCAEGMVEWVNKKNEVGTTIGHCYCCKECAFECATRAACVAHARRKHTDKLIGPCDYCGTYYAHLADSMKHHVNECAGSTTSSDNTDD